MPLATRRHASGAAAVLGFIALLFASLGVAWGLSRVQYRERPRWEEAAFPVLRRAPGAAEGWSERWVVAVHPGCPHCRVSLESLAAARDGGAFAVRVTALLVDTPVVPHDSVLVRLPADETRWDSSGRWRTRWGHRVYGEVLCFDSEGGLRRVVPPFGEAAEAARRLAVHGLAGAPE